jgi:hypothetical protein
MDARFCERLERAIANGKERAPVPPLTDQQMEILRALATPLRPAQRPLFLRQVLQRLHGITELGDGTVAQAARAVQADRGCKRERLPRGRRCVGRSGSGSGSGFKKMSLVENVEEFRVTTRTRDRSTHDATAHGFTTR